MGKHWDGLSEILWNYVASTGTVMSETCVDIEMSDRIFNGNSDGHWGSDEADMVDLSKSGCKGSMQWDCIKGSDAGKS